MATQDRQERQLMRQRGAASRDVGKVDFGFKFGTTPRQSARKTSNTTRRTQKQHAQTPSHHVGSIVSRTSGARSQARNWETAEAAPEDAEPASKRRKTIRTSKGPPSTPSIPNGDPVNSSSTDTLFGRRRSSRRSTSAANFVIAEDPVPVTEAEDAPTQAEVIEPLEREADQENQTPADAEQHGKQALSKHQTIKRKKRRSIGQQSKRRKRTSGESNGSGRSSLQDIERRSPTVVSTEELHVQAQTEREPDSAEHEQREDILALEQSSTGSTHDAESANDEADDDESEAVRETATRLANPPSLARKATKTSRKRRRDPYDTIPPTPAHLRAEDSEDEEDQSYIPDPEGEPPTPAPAVAKKKNPAQPKLRTKSTDSGEQSARQKSKLRKDAYEIKTYRLANIDALPTIIEEFEVEEIDLEDEASRSDADAQAFATSHQRVLKQRFPDRVAPNIIDVLAQVVEECTRNTVAGLSNSSMDAAKLLALETFAAIVDERLRHHSLLIEERTTLENRAKNARRDKMDMQRRYLELRSKREDVAIKCDAVRRKHAEEKAEWTSRERIGRLAQEINVGRNRLTGKEPQNLDVQLKTLSNLVSTKSEQGGLLGRIKDFNSTLESIL